MDFGKLSTGMKLALIGGAVLVINLFLPWYSFGVAGLVSFSWNAFNAGFLAWGGSFLAIAAAVILLLKAMGTSDVEVGEFAAEQVAFALALVGALLIVLRFATETSFTSFGLYLGILAAIAVAGGSFMAMKDEGLSIPGTSGGGGAAAGGAQQTPWGESPEPPAGGPPEQAGGAPEQPGGPSQGGDD